MINPFKEALNRPNSYFIDIRTAAMRMKDPIFNDSLEFIETKFQELKKEGLIATVYKIDENGKASFFKK